jgi:hypothetical protein
MALPKWITSAGQLGIIPELEYYDYDLDAYDASGGTLVYSHISGKLPLGIQLIPTGKLQGIPVSELGGDQNVTYTFTIRVKNSVTNGLADRTFNITVSNVAPPIIIPRDVDLGLRFDGTILNIQLEAIEATPGATLSWRLKDGELPPGISLSAGGLLYGYIQPIIGPGPSSESGWGGHLDNGDPGYVDSAHPVTNPSWQVYDSIVTPWGQLGWDFSPIAISKTFNFTVEVFDGVNYDATPYNIVVTPQETLEADSTLITTDRTVTGAGELTIDVGARHEPIIVTTQVELEDQRQGSYFSFQIVGLDLDGDVLQYALPSTTSVTFDEQIIIGNGSPYIASTLIGGNLFVGVNSVENITKPALLSGDDIKILSLTTLDELNWYDATVNNYIKLRLTGDTIIAGAPGDFITQTISSANATIATISSTVGSIEVLGEVIVGTLTIRGNTNIGVLAVSDQLITANVGDFITQPSGTANATVRANVVNSPTVAIELTAGSFIAGNISVHSNVQINGTYINAYPISTVFNDVLVSANIGDIITQSSSGAIATVTANVVISDELSVTYSGNAFILESGNIAINSTNIDAYPYTFAGAETPVGITANIGDVITQTSSGATATVTANVVSTTNVPVAFTSGTFTTGSGNLTINTTDIPVYPIDVIAQADIGMVYNSAESFTLNSSATSAITYINAVSTGATPTSVISVGVTLGLLSTEGTIGFDESKFDQSPLYISDEITIDINSGWLTGRLPTISANEIQYPFEVVVYKRDYPAYQATGLFTLTVLGDLNNKINWITPSDLGTIENGRISDLSISAISTKGKLLYYNLSANSAHRLPQGLILTLGGLLSGRVSFELFSLDQGTTFLDGNILGEATTTFDSTYTFTVTAQDSALSVTSDRTFTIRVLNRNNTPYEDLYCKALPSKEQRAQFTSIMHNTSIFPPELIYRNEDPFFGLANDIKTLFLPGLNPSLLSEYAAVVSTNHYEKRIALGGVKTAVARDSNFNIKYEVVYLEVTDDNTNASGQGPADIVYPAIATPYYDYDGNAYTTAYPNAFSNMKDVTVAALGYANKGALPDWMTSRQENGFVLGFTRAVVLAYTVPGASSLIAYRFAQQNYNMNEIDFTVDRYQVDNIYSANYDITAGAFITSSETTFDRYPGLSSVFADAGTVDYAITTPYEDINNRAKSAIISIGGLDGMTHFKDGETLVFAQQEFKQGQNDIGDYNQGWRDVTTVWGGDSWDYDAGTPGNVGSVTLDDLGWDAAGAVPGYNEHNFDPLIANERIGIWRININADNIVTLTYIQEVTFYNKLYVRNGFTYGTSNIYYDPVVKSGNLIPNYTAIPEEIQIISTQFDGNGTRFYSYRDSYTIPEAGDKYIKFAKLGVFN